MSAILKCYNTVAAKLSQLSVSNGNLIFVTDTKKIYLDINGSRLCYDTIQVFATDKDRLATLAPVEGFYCVEETSVLWRYSGSWKRLTPEDITPVIYGASASDFPAQGNSKLLYVTDDATYRWDESSSSYVMIANKTCWTDMMV